MSWSWTKMLGALSALNPTMKALENELSLNQKYRTAQATVRTTDATTTTLVNLAVPVDVTALYEGLVVARRTGGSSGSTNDAAGYQVAFVAKNTSGTAALIGSGTVTVLGESQAGWDCTLSASAGDIRVRVTGAADNAIVWSWVGQRFTVEE